MTRLPRTRRLAAGLILGLAAMLGLQGAGPALAQLPEGHPPSGTSADRTPPPPPGPATISGQVVMAGTRKPVAGVSIALYGLSTSGGAGVAGVDTDTDGRFAFKNVSNQSDTMYILGARYRDVPFGQRVSFAPGQLEQQIEIEVSEPTDDVSTLSHPQRGIQLDLLGSQLRVRESHMVVNSGGRVVFLGEASRAGRKPFFQVLLPPGARDFDDGRGAMGNGGDREGNAVSYWGPFYPGEQEVAYQYQIDLPPTGADGEPSFALPIRQAMPVERIVVLAASDGPSPSAPGLIPTDETVELDGQTYLKLEAPGPKVGGQLDLALRIPEARSDPEALRLARADFWLDMDDTTMKVSIELELVVDGSTRLRARGDEPLLRLPMPEDAELLGLSPSARGMGITADEAGLALRGPIPPGKTDISFAYRTPVRGRVPSVDLSFSRPVATLNLLIADTGLAVQSDRLHRRRPFKSGTRLYLHRQGYQIDPGEVVSASFEPLERRGVPRNVATAGTIALTALATWFIVAPLRRTIRDEDDSQNQALTNLALERENVYDSIRDLQADFEMGKIDPGDYERIQKELRAEAVELLRRAKAREAAPAVTSATPAKPTSQEERESDPVCAGCGGRLDPSWRFCSHCGHVLQVADTDAAEPGA